MFPPIVGGEGRLEDAPGNLFAYPLTDDGGAGIETVGEDKGGPCYQTGSLGIEEVYGLVGRGGVGRGIVCRDALMSRNRPLPSANSAITSSANIVRLAKQADS